MRSSGAVNFIKFENFRAEYFGDNFGGKALAAVNFIAGRQRQICRSVAKFKVAAHRNFARIKFRAN